MAEEKEAKNDDKKDDAGGSTGDDPGTGGTERESLAELVKKEVAAAFAALKGEGDKTPEHQRRVDVEAESERIVQEASKKLQAKQEREKKAAEDKALKDDVERIKQKVEVPPVKVRRLTKLLWGDDE